MRAAVYHQYGAPEVLAVEDVPQPQPREGEVLVRVHASTVCAGDVRLRRAKPFFLRGISGLWHPTKRPTPGMEFAGTVEQTGPSVTGFARADSVFGSTGLKFGANAEYACVAAGPLLVAKPPGLSFEDAAGIPFGGVSALHFLRLAKVGSGQDVLVYGASGSVGTYAVQLAKILGARVTAVCSTANLGLMASLGADETIDYTAQDFSKTGRRYDVVFDAVGKSGFERSVRALKRGGTYVFAASGLVAPTLGKAWCTITGRARVPSGMARAKPGDLAYLAGLVESGSLRPVIDRCYPLDQIAEAHRYVESGHKKGVVIIAVGERDA